MSAKIIKSKKQPKGVEYYAVEALNGYGFLGTAMVCRCPGCKAEHVRPMPLLNMSIEYDHQPVFVLGCLEAQAFLPSSHRMRGNIEMAGIDPYCMTCVAARERARRAAQKKELLADKKSAEKERRHDDALGKKGVAYCSNRLCGICERRREIDRNNDEQYDDYE
jgi:hypothetical protein